MKPKELEQRLWQFLPSPTRHRHFTGLLYTDGILYIIEQLEMEWLVLAMAEGRSETIATHQSTPAITLNDGLKQCQCWKLLNEPQPTLSCYRNQLNSDPIFTQSVRVTAFPLPELELFVDKGVLMLPSEYDGS